MATPVSKVMWESHLYSMLTHLSCSRDRGSNTME